MVGQGSNLNSEGLKKLYRNAGPNFLAIKMERIFMHIETDEQRVLHNDILEDVLTIVEGEKQAFYRAMVDLILNTQYNKKRRFLFRLAGQVLNLGSKKG